MKPAKAKTRKNACNARFTPGTLTDSESPQEKNPEGRDYFCASAAGSVAR